MSEDNIWNTHFIDEKPEAWGGFGSYPVPPNHRVREQASKTGDLASECTCLNVTAFWEWAECKKTGGTEGELR